MKSIESSAKIYFKFSFLASYLEDFIARLEALLRGGAAGLHGGDKDADLVSARQTDANAAGFLEADEAGVGAKGRDRRDIIFHCVIGLSRSLTDFLFLQSSADLLCHNLQDKRFRKL